MYGMLEESRKLFAEIEGKEFVIENKSLSAPFNSKSTFELVDGVLSIIPEKVKPADKDKKNTSNVTKFKAFNFDKHHNTQHTKYTMPLSHFEGHNFWILKATNLNRGRGIHVFQTID